MIGNLATKLCGRTSGSNQLSQVTSALLDFKTKKMVWCGEYFLGITDLLREEGVGSKGYPLFLVLFSSKCTEEEKVTHPFVVSFSKFQSLSYSTYNAFPN